MTLVSSTYHVGIIVISFVLSSTLVTLCNPIVVVVHLIHASLIHCSRSSSIVVYPLVIIVIALFRLVFVLLIQIHFILLLFEFYTSTTSSSTYTMYCLRTHLYYIASIIYYYYSSLYHSIHSTM